MRSLFTAPKAKKISASIVLIERERAHDMKRTIHCTEKEIEQMTPYNGRVMRAHH